MSRTQYAQVRHDNDELATAFTDLVLGLEMARDALTSLRRDENPLDFDADDLQDYIDMAEELAEHYNRIADEEYEQELEQARREYWRSV